jgi:hypothetical protein
VWRRGPATYHDFARQSARFRPDSRSEHPFAGLAPDMGTQPARAIRPMKPILMTTVFVGVLAAGCTTSAPPPNDQWTAAQVAVGRAQALAPAVPDAKLHLQLAEEDLQKSKELMGNDNKRATTLVELATVEAQLATSLARANGAENADRQTQDDLNKTINK